MGTPQRECLINDGTHTEADDFAIHTDLLEIFPVNGQGGRGPFPFSRPCFFLPALHVWLSPLGIAVGIALWWLWH